MMSTLIDTPYPTRRAGLDHLERIRAKLGHKYAAERNFDYGPGHHKKYDDFIALDTTPLAA